MVDNNGLYPHHRRPTSLNGEKTKPYNISRVSHEDHNLYHKLYGNMNAYQTAIQMTIDLWSYKHCRVVVICKYVNGIEEVEFFGNGGVKNLKIRGYMFRRFMGNQGVSEFIQDVNSNWLDSAYHFSLKFFKKIKKRKLKK